MFVQSELFALFGLRKNLGLNWTLQKNGNGRTCLKLKARNDNNLTVFESGRSVG